MRAASSSFAVVALFVACSIGRAESDEVTPTATPARAYAVACRVVSLSLLPAEAAKSRKVQPLSFTAPRIVVSSGGTATISDTTEETFVFGDAPNFQGERTPIECKATEGTRIEATVLAQDDNHVVLDLTAEFSSADAPAGEGTPVRVDFEKSRWIERVELGKPVTLTTRDWHLEVTVSPVREADADVKSERVGQLNNAGIEQRPVTIAYVRYAGSRLKARHLTKQTGLRPGQPLEVAKVEAGRQRLLAYYREKGYSNVAISIAEGTGKDDRGVVYQIDEGEQAKKAL
jgi:hypothetical protein